MVHHPKRHPAPLEQRPRHQRIVAVVVAVMVLALAIYGYQLWWSE
jgi:hypothetical protein